ncbi:radical SAM protein [Candidatus Woesearchaeota archaeon]|nr:radical SAM protein [Candidatus Woesearchaeota archaeon]
MPKTNDWFLCNREDFTPAYLKSYDEGLLQDKIDKALKLLENCEVCPRKCHVNRLENKKGVCLIGRHAKVSSFFPHFGEENCLRGWNGSGTIFFSYCNLKCVFCQNFDVSWKGQGEEVTAQDIAEMMIYLQEKGCHNTNWVTPEHVVPQILEALPIAIDMGLNLSIVYNTSSYDSIDSLKLMDGIVDIYMPDFKFFTPELAKFYLGAENYPEAAKEAIKEMQFQVGELKFDEDGLALRGVLLRHLVMPHFLNETEKIMEWIANEVSKDVYINMMDQYYPAGMVLNQPERYNQITRKITNSEFAKAVKIAKEFGLNRFDERAKHLQRFIHH